MKTQISDLLKSVGLKRTQAREAVLILLNKSDCPLSHQEIISKKQISSFDRVTIYRTLDSLTKIDLLHKVLGSDGVWRFCAHQHEKGKVCGGNHIHFLCRQCNKMFCMPEQPLPWVKAPAGAKIESKQLVVRGVCRKCISPKNKE